MTEPAVTHRGVTRGGAARTARACSSPLLPRASSESSPRTRTRARCTSPPRARSTCTGELWSVADGLDKPNGLPFSPDESVLYVGDNGRPHRLLAFDVRGGFLADPRVFAVLSPEHPDGVRVDAEGRVYATSADGIHVFSPDGRPLDEIALPGAVNFALTSDAMIITADRGIWTAGLPTRGA
jgi:sugar lactone lactonase YvrE